MNVKFNSLKVIGILVLVLCGSVFGQVQLTSKDQKNDWSSQNSLSNFESLNMFGGGLNFNIPLASVGGRGAVGSTINLSIEQKWQVLTIGELSTRQ